MNKCPGQDNKILKTEDIRCSCGCYVEIFSDELKRKCLKCGKEVTRPRKMTCFDWCKFADLCRKDINERR